ncbi:MAG: DUF885 family protein [Caulobacter sp.]|nr:DUF885 family protein [Caulobacter sp.]
MSKRVLLGLALVLALNGAAVAATPKGPSAADRLAQAVKAYEAAGAGEDDGEGGADEASRFKFPPVGPKADAERKALLTSARQSLDGVDLSVLNANQKLTHAILKWSLDERLEGLSFDEARLPFSTDGGFDVILLYRANGMHLKSEDEAKQWIALLAQTPDWYAANIANARRGVATGFVQAVPTAQAVLDRARRTAATPIAEEPLLAPLRDLPSSISADRQAALLAEGTKVVTDKVAPARAGFVTFMEQEYLPHAAKSLAVSDLPDGARYYAFLVRRHTTTTMTADQVHALGQAEVARIRARMEIVMKQAGFQGDLPAFIAFLRKDPRFYATSRQQLLEKASEIAKRADDQLPAHFGTLPRLTYGVRPVPASIEQGYTTGRYFGGDPKTGRAGGLMINTSALDQRPLYELPALVLHEGAPGHHIQTSLAQEQAGVPDFRKTVYFNAYGEGWGLYSEWLGEEMGIYRDPYELFGRLSYEMWRACRLVADTGLHAKHWTLDQAKACFVENTALSPTNIDVEVARYISWPGQALAYKVGELKILELRKRAETALGDKFDERAFHDAVLLNGSLPLAVLEQKIDAWIAARKR